MSEDARDRVFSSLVTVTCAFMGGVIQIGLDVHYPVVHVQDGSFSWVALLSHGKLKSKIVYPVHQRKLNTARWRIPRVS